MGSRNKDTIELLISRGANVNCTDTDGDTPLHFLFRLSLNPEIFILLMKHGADTSIKNNAGITVQDLGLKSTDQRIVEIFDWPDCKEPAF
jgi:ankyrin repeat protein